MDPTLPAWGTEVTTVNGSNLTLPTLCDHMSLSVTFLIVLIAVAGLAGNAIVLWLLGFRMRRNAFTVYVLNLAGADFLFLCFHVAYSIKCITNFLHSISIYIPTFSSIVFTFAYLAGLSMLSAISAERCLSVLWPIWYRCQRPRQTSTVVSALLWALSLLLSLLEGEECCFRFKRVYEFCETFDFITTAWLIVLFVILFGSSLTLLVRIFCSSQRVPVTRLYVTITLTVLVFLLFGLPFGIHKFLLQWIMKTLKITHVDFAQITTLTSCVNSSANPIIYFFVGSFRHHRFQGGTLKLLLQRALQDTPEEEECGERGSSGKPGKLETVYPAVEIR
ncbi:mas-related G-protein coupled receptor member X2-like [Nannospalax galili]|uniref:mas-related G-protein coupled receptor member X2-like n=1 Tax=Nannospalax galili TaxID=1026970 RepID=UPI0004ED504A|nr:mas-related G-protein coupled receptor member X2-like [Nannospalax galili]